MCEQEELLAEFPKNEVKFRVGSTKLDYKTQKKVGKPLAYIDARAVMDRLDEVLGFECWQDEYKYIGNRTICSLKLKIKDEWITKEDGAGDTNIEGEKGGISDALKRAAVKFGIGRYLYHLDFKWVELDTYTNKQGKVIVKGFCEEFKRNPWSYLIKDKGTYDKAKNEAANQMRKILSGEPTDPKVIGRFQMAYPELAMAVDLVSSIHKEAMQ